MKAIIRTNASNQIGLGHLYRCLTLADMLHTRGVDCHFVTNQLSSGPRELVLNSPHQLMELPEEASASRELLSRPCQLEIDYIYQMQPAIVIFDSYRIDSQYESHLKSLNVLLVVIDDLANRPHVCDILVDPCPKDSCRSYDELVPPSTIKLLGLDYCLLRPEFSHYRGVSLASVNKEASRDILISMGGTDPNNTTLQILMKLVHEKVVDLSAVTVLLGPGSKNRKSIELFLRNHNLQIKLIDSTSNMAKLMSGFSLIIGASGSTSWERCALGLPSISFSIAENQVATGKVLERELASIYLGEFSKYSCEKLAISLKRLSDDLEYRLRLSKNASRLVDGKGTQRIVDAIIRRYTHCTES